MSHIIQRVWNLDIDSLLLVKFQVSTGSSFMNTGVRTLFFNSNMINIDQLKPISRNLLALI